MKPLLTEPFLKYLSKINTKNKTILEIGSGNSTVYFEKIFKKVISLEDNKKWYDKVSNQISNKTNLVMFDKNNILKIINNCLGKKPDYILIDNDPKNVSRFDVANFIHQNKEYHSMIILDNGEKNLDAYSLLKSYYYSLDFVGKRHDNKLSVTTLFFSEKHYKKVYI